MPPIGLPFEVSGMKQKTKRVLSFIHSNGGAATTHDITTETEIDDNDAARYQLKKLEEAGYVELSKIEEGHYTVTQATLTENGESELEDYYRDLGQAVATNSEVMLKLIEDLDAEGIINIDEYREQFSQ